MGPMARAGKTHGFFLDRATQVRADQAQGAESACVVNEKGRNIRDDLARSRRGIRSRAKVEIGRRGRFGLVIQEADQPAQAEQTAQGKEAIPCEFEKITARKVRHIPLSRSSFHRVALVAILRGLLIGFLLAAAAHHRAEGETLAGGFIE